jgi:hypothetical protein
VGYLSACPSPVDVGVLYLHYLGKEAGAKEIQIQVVLRCFPLRVPPNTGARKDKSNSFHGLTNVGACKKAVIEARDYRL